MTWNSKSGVVADEWKEPEHWAAISSAVWKLHDSYTGAKIWRCYIKAIFLTGTPHVCRTTVFQAPDEGYSSFFISLTIWVCQVLIPARAKQTPDPKLEACCTARQAWETSATLSGPNHLDVKLVFGGKSVPPPDCDGQKESDSPYILDLLLTGSRNSKVCSVPVVV